MLFTGRALKYGNDINTDLIIPGKYTKTLNFDMLASHVMEDIDPDFRKKLSQGDFVVAGSNFGCGSSREQAAVALKRAGVACIAAKSFARIFYRNSINIGLPLIECDTDFISEGDHLEYLLGGEAIKNTTTGVQKTVTALPQIMVHILLEGGLVPYMKKYGGYKET